MSEPTAKVHPVAVNQRSEQGPFHARLSSLLRLRFATLASASISTHLGWLIAILLLGLALPQCIADGLIDAKTGIKALPTKSAHAWLEHYQTLAAKAPASCPPVTIPRLDASVPKRAFILEPSPAQQALKPLVATLKDPIVDYFIVLAEDGDGCIQVGLSGRAVPFDWRTASSPFPNSRLPDRFGATPAVAIVADSKVMRPWIEVLPLHQFAQRSEQEWIILGMLTGMLASFLIAAILIAHAQGSALIYAYLVYILCMLFYQFQALGLGRVWLPFWPSDSIQPLMQALATGTGLLSMTLVIALFLQPRGWLRIVIFTSAALSIGALYLSAIVPSSYRLAAAMLLVMAIPVVGLLLLRLRTGDASVRWFALGIVAVILGAGTQALSIVTSGAWLPPQAGFASLFGNLIEAICWLLAIISRMKAEHSELQRRLLYEAQHDSLTGCYSRRYMRERIGQAIAAAKRPADGASGLLYIDLGAFKTLNDRFGQAVGDDSLCQFCSVLKQLNLHADSIGRYGGDEFVILMRQDAHWSHTDGAAATILGRFQEPLELKEHSVLVRPDIGILHIGAEYSDVDEVIQDANRALQVSKQLGGRRATLFEPQMRNRAKTKQALRDALEDAIRNHQLDLHYQPMVELDSLLPVGLEALLRCPHLSQKGISIEQIFAVAEATGMLNAIGERVIELALTQILAWQRQGVWSTGLFIGVNVCAQQLIDGRFLGYLHHASQRYGIDASAIRFELSEGSLGADLDWSHHVLPRLLNQQVLLGIDNFGAGLASLTMLTDLQPDYIKLDRRLVNKLPTLPRAQNLARIALLFNTETGSLAIAEGIETNDQLKTLRELGFQHGQGHLIAAPMSGTDTANWLQLAARPREKPRQETGQPWKLH
ncbi:MAG: hypothetical protein C1943_02060 [Halochromatium sp.]|nr:hypothetical protein [Halochromatium sp.]